MLLSGLNQQEITHLDGIPPRGHWTINKSGGEVRLATDFGLSGAAQDLFWDAGNLNLSSNTLSVGRNVTISGGTKSLGVTVADATKAGRLTIVGTASGISNVNLEVQVDAVKTDVEEQTYTILSNNVALNSAFASVAWIPPWKGTVFYTANGGKNITIADLIQQSQGTIFIIQ